MNRNHTIEEYLEIIEKLKRKKPSIKFSSDFIIAYPGETEDDFEKTMLLMKQVEFINSLPADTFQQIQTFLKELPAVSMEVPYKIKLNGKNKNKKTVLKGLNDFF